jgi:hypothetical protein
MHFKRLTQRSSAQNYSLVLINGIKYKEYSISDLPRKYLRTDKNAELDALYNHKSGVVYILKE